MEPYKLKVKIGGHEFEAEGPQEAVQAQFAAFKELVSSAQVAGKSETQGRSISTSEVVDKLGTGQVAVDQAIEAERFLRLFRRDKDSLSLTVLPQGERREADAVMLLLLGNRVLLGKDSVTAVTLSASLRQSGISVERLDRVLNPFIGGAEPLLLRIGLRRSVQYRLTNLGLARAERVGDDLLRVIP